MASRTEGKSESHGPLNGNLGDLPWWARAAVFLGVPSVIAMFLVYTLTTQMQTAMTEIRHTQALQAQTLLEMQKAIGTRMADLNIDRQSFSATADHLEQLIRRACIVASQTAEERATCLDQPRPRPAPARRGTPN